MKHFTFTCVEFWASIYISAIGNMYQESSVHIPVLAARFYKIKEWFGVADPKKD